MYVRKFTYKKQPKGKITKRKGDNRVKRSCVVVLFSNIRLVQSRLSDWTVSPPWQSPAQWFCAEAKICSPWEGKPTACCVGVTSMSRLVMRAEKRAWPKRALRASEREFAVIIEAHVFFADTLLGINKSAYRHTQRSTNGTHYHHHVSWTDLLCNSSKSRERARNVDVSRTARGLSISTPSIPLTATRHNRALGWYLHVPDR